MFIPRANKYWMLRNNRWVIVPDEVSRKLMRINSRLCRQYRKGPDCCKTLLFETVRMDDKPLLYDVRFGYDGRIHYAQLAMVETDGSFEWFEVRNEKTEPASRVLMLKDWVEF